MPAVEKIYIIELATDEKLTLRYTPETISDNATAKLPSISTPGRNLEQFQHLGVGDEVSFKIDINGTYNMNEPDYVIKRVKWLKSLVFHGGRSKPASYVQIIWGNMFKGLNFVVSSVSAELSDFRPALKNNPNQAYVNISLKLVGDNVTKDSIRK